MAYSVVWTQDFHGNVTTADVQGLLADMADATVFIDWPWLSSCFDHAGGRAWFLLVREPQGRLRALLPLQLCEEKRLGITHNVLRWLQYPFGDRLLPLLQADAPDIRGVVIEALRHTPFRWDCMIWNDVPDSGSLLADWREAAGTQRMALYMQKKSTCPILMLEGRSVREIDETLSKSARQRVKRARKRLMQEHQVEILHDRPRLAGLEPRLAEFKAVENHSWKGDEGVGIFSTPASWEFFQTLAMRLAERDQLDLGEIRIGGALASYRFGMHFRGVFLDYNLAYLPEYHKLGLGRILLDELVTDCMKQQYRAVDGSRVGRHSQHLLFERANVLLDHWQLSWYANTAKARGLRLINETLVVMARRVRAQIKVWQQHWQQHLQQRHAAMKTTAAPAKSDNAED